VRTKCCVSPPAWDAARRAPAGAGDASEAAPARGVAPVDVMFFDSPTGKGVMRHHRLIGGARSFSACNGKVPFVGLDGFSAA